MQAILISLQSGAGQSRRCPRRDGRLRGWLAYCESSDLDNSSDNLDRQPYP
jgi:hypothetical protein